MIPHSSLFKGTVRNLCAWWVRVFVLFVCLCFFVFVLGVVLVRFLSNFGTLGIDFGVILSTSGSILVSFCDPRGRFWRYFGVLGGLLATLGPQGTPEGGRVEEVTENTVRVYTSWPPNGT